MARPAETIRSAAQARWPGASVIERGRNYIVHAHPTEPGRIMVDTSAGPLHINNSETEIDSQWQPTGGGAWQYQMVTADYHAFARNVLNAGDAIQYVHPGSGESVTFQPLSINWTNQDNSRQQIAITQAVTAQATGDVLDWQNAFGTGRHFQWQTQVAHLRKVITIDSAANLPTATVSGTVWLETEFQLKNSSGVELYLDGVRWPRSNNARVTTGQRIEFRQETTGNTLWWLDFARAWDSAGNEIIGQLQVRRQGPNFFVTVRIPQTWIDAATFPIFLDPTIDPTIGASGDDGEWREGNSSFGNTALGLTFGLQGTAAAVTNMFLRFIVTGPASGDTVDVANVTFRARANASASAPMIISCVDADNPAAPTDYSGAEGATRTTANVGWSVQTVSNNDFYTTPDISAPIQEVFDRPGWASGNALIVYVEDNGSSGTRTADSFDHGSDIPLLHIEYTEGGGGGTTHNLSATLTATSATPAASLAVARSLAAALGATGVTPNASLSVSRSLAATLAADSATPAVSLAVARSLATSIAATSATPDAALLILRSLSATATAQSSTPDASLVVARSLAAILTAASATPDDVTLTVAGLISFAATLTAASNTPDASLAVARSLAAAVLAQSSTPDAALSVARSLSAQATATSATPDANLAILRSLAAVLSAASATPAVAMSVARSLVATLTAASATPDDVLLSISGLVSFAATLTAQSATPAASLAVARPFAATLSAASDTPSATLTILRSLSATLTAESATPAANLVVARALAAVLSAASSTPDTVSLDIAGLISFAATLTATSQTPAAILSVARSLAATLTAVSATPDAGLGLRFSLAAILSAASATSDTASLVLLRSLSAILTAESATPDAAMSIRRSMAATLTATSATPDTANLGLAYLLTAIIVATSQTPDDVNLQLHEVQGLVSVLFAGLTPGATFAGYAPGATFAGKAPGVTFTTSGE